MLIIRKATIADNDALCKLCEHPMQGSIGIALERNPNFFNGSYVQCEQPEVFLVYNQTNHEVLGMFSIGTRRVWLNRTVTKIRYFSDLRLKEGVQRVQTLFSICNFISNSGFLIDTIAQTIVFNENIGMNRVIELLNRRARKHSVFQYFKHGAYVSHMVHVSNKALPIKHFFEIAQAKQTDVQQMQVFLDIEGSKHPFFPYYNLQDLGSSYHLGLRLENFYLAKQAGEIRGILAFWDQTEYKQTRIKSYAKYLHFVRPFVNLFAKFFGGFSLPGINETMHYVSLHCVLIQDQNPEAFKALLNRILSDIQPKGYQYLMCGLPQNHPFQMVLKKFTKTRTINGTCYLVGNDKSPALSNPEFYLELGRI